jgi:hypothetical protein
VSITSDLLTGIATDLNSQLIATFTGADGGNVFFKELPPFPDVAVALTAYSSVDEPKIAASTVRVQFWFRGAVDDSLSCDVMADAAFDYFQGLEDRTYGSVHVAQAFRVSSIQLGADSQRRHERSDNYEFDLDLPLTAGRPF